MHPWPETSRRSQPPPAYDENLPSVDTARSQRGMTLQSLHRTQPGGPSNERTPLLPRSPDSKRPPKWNMYPVYLTLIVFVILGVAWDNERQNLIAMREQLVRDREQFAYDREQWIHDREMDKREDRVRAGLYWGDLKSEKRCLRYDTREYSAPLLYNTAQACTDMPVEIHGVKISRPDQCDDKGSSGVFGHWTVNSEPACVTYFGEITEQGCTSPGSGRKRFEARLWNLQPGDDWREMCATTPADFRRMHFDGPDMCEHHGLFGVWGMWELKDRTC
ncbi:hypothetical protein DFH06DRAFT_1208558 [Mycena polygramma]|nr:hypothetical protein DFH06DRAFT_1259355 [Mycena polygramma]KAJ7649579.1 hypothetical protein DFH06DRAFT_1208558 [Mycena polygramma]